MDTQDAVFFECVADDGDEGRGFSRVVVEEREGKEDVLVGVCCEGVEGDGPARGWGRAGGNLEDSGSGEVVEVVVCAGEILEPVSEFIGVESTFIVISRIQDGLFDF